MTFRFEHANAFDLLKRKKIDKRAIVSGLNGENQNEDEDEENDDDDGDDNNEDERGKMYPVIPMR